MWKQQLLEHSAWRFCFTAVLPPVQQLATENNKENGGGGGMAGLYHCVKTGSKLQEYTPLALNLEADGTKDKSN